MVKAFPKGFFIGASVRGEAHPPRGGGRRLVLLSIQESRVENDVCISNWWYTHPPEKY